MDESDKNKAQAVGLPKALRDNREAFEKIRAKNARFPEIFQALGKLAVESTQLEAELKITFCQLLTIGHAEMHPDVVNAIAQERRPFAKLAELVKKLFDAYVKDEKKRKPFHAALKEANKLMEERGNRIHGFWSLDYTTDKVAHFAHKATRESVDPEDIEKIVKKMQVCKDSIYGTLVKAFRS
jgi:hypothetical protein